MGYRSDVGLAVKSSSVEKLESAGLKILLDTDRKIRTADGHVLYLWTDYKWYEDFTSDLMVRLEEIGKKEYLLVEVGHDTDHTVTNGSWYGNPFCLGYTHRLDYIDTEDTIDEADLDIPIDYVETLPAKSVAELQAIVQGELQQHMLEVIGALTPEGFQRIEDFGRTVLDEIKEKGVLP